MNGIIDGCEIGIVLKYACLLQNYFTNVYVKVQLVYSCSGVGCLIDTFTM